MIGVTIGNIEEDENHRYGHERIECVASLILSFILFITGLEIGIEGIKLLIENDYDSIATPGVFALIVAVVSILAKEIMYQYTIRVAKKTYKVAKFLRFKNYELTTKASLLHDYYLDNEIDEYTSKEKLFIHPNKALENAKDLIEINKISEDIIKNHMFPLTKHIPKTKEGVLVSIVDKLVSLYEMCFFKATLQVSIIMLFIFNIININD